MYNLSHKSASILNEKATLAGEKSYGPSPVGTGAYRLAEWQAGNFVKLVKNTDYFRGEPSIPYVLIKAVLEENSKLIGLETGEIDIAADLTPFSRKMLEGNKKSEIHMAAGLG